jgi:hypothetical protein
MCMQPTSWYYVRDGEQKGPVEQSEFESLVSEGTIGAGTLVWQEGMADWQPYAEVAAPAQAAAPVMAAPRVALGLAGEACSRCGQTVPVEEVVRIGGVAVCANCRPLALQNLQAGGPHQESVAEQLRKGHLCREAYVKSVGTLYYAAGGLFVLVGLGLAFVPPEAAARRAGPLLWLVVAGFAALLIATGAGLRHLRPWSRIASGVLAGIGVLANFPSGTLINGFILYLLFSKKGSMVFSEPYQQVIAATPHIKYRTPLYVWILLALFLLAVAYAFVVVLSGPRGR